MITSVGEEGKERAASGWISKSTDNERKTPIYIYSIQLGLLQ